MDVAAYQVMHMRHMIAHISAQSAIVRRGDPRVNLHVIENGTFTINVRNEKIGSKRETEFSNGRFFGELVQCQAGGDSHRQGAF
jgi:hypothetical protein